MVAKWEYEVRTDSKERLKRKQHRRPVTKLHLSDQDIFGAVRSNESSGRMTDTLFWFPRLSCPRLNKSDNEKLWSGWQLPITQIKTFSQGLCGAISQACEWQWIFCIHYSSGVEMRRYETNYISPCIPRLKVTHGSQRRRSKREDESVWAVVKWVWKSSRGSDKRKGGSNPSGACVTSGRSLESSSYLHNFSLSLLLFSKPREG